MTNKFSIRTSGDGCELLNSDGEVVAWTLDHKWAWRILVALEMYDPMDSAEW
jgi:hypothetical protein